MSIFVYENRVVFNDDTYERPYNHLEDLFSETFVRKRTPLEIEMNKKGYQFLGNRSPMNRFGRVRTNKEMEADYMKTGEYLKVRIIMAQYWKRSIEKFSEKEELVSDLSLRGVYFVSRWGKRPQSFDGREYAPEADSSGTFDSDEEDEEDREDRIISESVNIENFWEYLDIPADSPRRKIEPVYFSKMFELKRIAREGNGESKKAIRELALLNRWHERVVKDFARRERYN